MTQTRTVTVADTRFLLREQGVGDGTPVLLLHGVPETSRVWRDVQPGLAEGRRVLAPDLPGLGGSSYSGPYDVPSVVAQLAALIESEVGGRVDVVGHDWGGSLALGLAGARPELVRRLCVANAPYREVPLFRAAHISFFALPAAPELVFRLGGPQIVELMFKVAWRAKTPLDPEVCAEYAAAYGDPQRVAAMLGYYRAAVRPKLAALLAGRPAPAGPPRVKVEQCLVLWGAADPVLPVATGESVVRDLGPGCAMVTVPGAGHFVIEEAPDIVLSVLRDFLADDRPLPAADEPITGAAKVPARKAPARKPPAGTAPATKAPAKKGPAKGAGPSSGT